jgi:hypothetical protein
VRNDLAVGLAAGVAVGFAVGFVPLMPGLPGGLLFWLAVGLAGFRYVGLLLCTRRYSTRWLPW